MQPARTYRDGAWDGEPRRRPRPWLCLLLGGALLATAHAASSARSGGDRSIEFNRDIRPILSDKCYTCHGPDKSGRLSALRLDREDSALSDLGEGRHAVVPGDPSNSELIRRVTAAEEARRMPPVYTDKTLTPREIALLSGWIEQGAKWQPHWSFIPPRKPDLPAVTKKDWPRNPIDSFILARLDQDGLEPSPEAGRETLLRRLSFDLTGIPPTIEELDEFLNDTAPDAYEKVVDRLLASPRYGERLAIRWLDAARYADTNGYQTDAERFMWRWRDWVIESFNQNKPFDQFTVEQLAGDLLPNPTLNQLIATGFNRNHRGNGEGGIVPEEFLAEYVVDRVDTTSTVWLGLTVGCARCHDHKYDPIKQKEFYQLFAYFNNVPESGKAFKYGNSPPFIAAPTESQQAELAALDQRIETAQQKFARIEAQRQQAQREWEASLASLAAVDWSVSDGLLFQQGFDSGLSFRARADGNQVDGVAEWHGPGEFASGPLGQAARFGGEAFVEAGDVANIGFYDGFSVAAWIRPESTNGAILARTELVAEIEGWGLYLKDGKLQLNLVKRWLDDALRVEMAPSLEPGRWYHVAVTYDGSRQAKGVRFYLNGQAVEMTVHLDELNQPFSVGAPFRIGSSVDPQSRFRGEVDEIRIYDRLLGGSEVATLAVPETVTAIAALPVGQRSAAQSDKIRWSFLDDHAPPPIRASWSELQALRKQRERFVDSLPTVMVMREMETPRESHVLARGAYDHPAEIVTPGVPEVLPRLPEGAPHNRLGLARWLVDPKHPLTARVTVNRFWQMLWGTGLVKTAEDFGSQGEWPIHADLLDWLATEFIEQKWDVKGILKTIVMSATYRQSSSLTAEMLEADPENRLLARGPRYRLPAEIVRDQALAVSGLLVEKIGGPSVKTYQPPGLWSELANTKDYEQDQGDKLFRRSLYTFWKRTSPPPMMMNFDAAGRETCIVRTARTNTPLQALNLMNDVTFVEAARALAERMLKEGGETPAQRAAYAYRLATAHRLQPRQQGVLLNALDYYQQRYAKDAAAALQLVSVGDSPRDESLDAPELAAYTSLASLILNLDKAITKE